jgi:GNAT superfamily N-acetyltransferase
MSRNDYPPECPISAVRFMRELKCAMDGNGIHPGDQIRTFRTGDLAEVKRLVDATIETSYAGVYPREAIDFFLSYHTAEHILEDAKLGYTVVLTAGEIAGTGTLLGSTIKRVFVHPSHQRRGYGTLLMQALEREALERGIRKVDLSASLPSKRFYDVLRYETECEAYIPLRNGKRLDYYAMVKDLG